MGLGNQFLGTGLSGLNQAGGLYNDAGNMYGAAAQNIMNQASPLLNAKGSSGSGDKASKLGSKGSGGGGTGLLGALGNYLGGGAGGTAVDAGGTFASAAADPTLASWAGSAGGDASLISNIF
jgi:hypothetical protein